MKKRGLSGVVTVVILIALTVAAVAIVWEVVNGLINDKTSKTTSCFDLFEKVTINNDYTCYNTSNNEVDISIDVGDIEIEGVAVSVRSKANSKSFILTNTETSVDFVKYYSDSNYLGNVKAPNANEGVTYVFNYSSAGLKDTPTSIVVYPIVDGEKCDASDTQQNIEDCSALS